METIVSKPGSKPKASTPRRSVAKAHHGQLRDESTTKANAQSRSASMQSLELKDIATRDDLDASGKKQVGGHNGPTPPAPKKIQSEAVRSQPTVQEEAYARQPGARLVQPHQTVASNVSYGQTSMAATDTAARLSPLYFQSRQAYEDYLRSFAGAGKGARPRQYRRLGDTPLDHFRAHDNHIFIGT